VCYDHYPEGRIMRLKNNSRITEQPSAHLSSSRYNPSALASVSKRGVGLAVAAGGTAGDRYGKNRACEIVGATRWPLAAIFHSRPSELTNRRGVEGCEATSFRVPSGSMKRGVPQ
jgi:hypothetical protein